MLNLKDITYEIIFVFDNEKDKTIDIINSFMKDMNYKIVFNSEQYAGTARNCGLKESIGEFIWFVDGDDWIIYPDVLQFCIPHLKEIDGKIIKIGFVSNLFKMEHYSMVWQYIFKRDFIIDIPFCSAQKYEDNDFMDRVFEKIGDNLISNFNVPCYFYNYNRPDSVTYKINRGLI